MSLLISNAANLRAQNGLMQAYVEYNRSSLRLATMRQINVASDDPSGLLAATALESELASLEAASTNRSRVLGVVDTADSALSEVGDLLTSIQGNVVALAGGTLSPEEADAKQMEIDAALQAIDRIGRTTSYNGRRLLDGRTMTFALSTDLTSLQQLSLPEIATSELGGEDGTLSDLASDGSVASQRDWSAAQAIVEAAAEQVNAGRAELGAFARYDVEAGGDAAAAAYVNLATADSRIADTDVAAETSNLIKAEIRVRTSLLVNSILSQSSMQILGLLARHAD